MGRPKRIPKAKVTASPKTFDEALERIGRLPKNLTRKQRAEASATIMLDYFSSTEPTLEARDPAEFWYEPNDT